MLRDNGSSFYLTLEEKEKWAIRTFLGKNGQGEIADELRILEDRLHYQKLEEQIGIKLTLT
ncbi:hypothetical protein BP422_12110 [Brevibacillus formosus]|uniref:Uncharacterized protein n=1 Tax=Brevibacillus formosus TaxID=54913 RepID=A0A220MGK9_9BACL|nr:hypothetical protein [Brevibacillus formosus]ASJ54226.1 hypothetical protein BP422_12110 [Brevibacillus formosus]